MAKPNEVVTVLVSDEALLKEISNVRLNLDLEDNRGDTALHYAAWEGDVSAIIGLLEHGADINARNKDGNTPLHTAVFGGQVSVIEELLKDRKVKADIEASNNDKNTPLHCAAWAGNRTIFDLLIKKGANRNTVNIDKESPETYLNLVQSKQAMDSSIDASTKIRNKAIGVFTYAKEQMASEALKGFVDEIIKDKSDNLQLLQYHSRIQSIKESIEKQFSKPEQREQRTRELGWFNWLIGYCIDKNILNLNDVQAKMKEIHDYYHAAAECGNPWGLGEMGLYYMEGRGGVVADFRKAFDSYKKGVPQGDYGSKIRLIELKKRIERKIKEKEIEQKKMIAAKEEAVRAIVSKMSQEVSDLLKKYSETVPKDSKDPEDTLKIKIAIASFVKKILDNLLEGKTFANASAEQNALKGAMNGKMTKELNESLEKLSQYYSLEYEFLLALIDFAYKANEKVTGTVSYWISFVDPSKARDKSTSLYYGLQQRLKNCFESNAKTKALVEATAKASGNPPKSNNPMGVVLPGNPQNSELSKGGLPLTLNKAKVDDVIKTDSKDKFDVEKDQKQGKLAVQNANNTPLILSSKNENELNLPSKVQMQARAIALGIPLKFANPAGVVIPENSQNPALSRDNLPGISNKPGT